MKIKTLLLSVLAAFALTACDDFLDITPTGKVIAKTGDEYRALLTYEYKYFAKDRYMTTLRTDEMLMDMVKTSSTDKDAYLDLWRWKDEAPSPTTSYFSWRTYYHTIYIANYVIGHQHEITNATKEEINQLVGESYMLRAYCHFLLVNLYAEPYTHCTPAGTRGVPMQLKADVNAIPASSSVEAVYQQVLSDLDEAEKYLNVEVWEEGKNYRFNKVSAQALRARTYLYMGQWKEALKAATTVLETHNRLEDLTTNSYTLPNSYKSVENIVALERFSSNLYTAINIPSPDFISMYRTGDQRRTKFYKRVTSSTYSLQKGGSDDNACSFRTSEMYLIAAEASARLDSLEKAVSYLVPLMEKRLNQSAYQTTLELVNSMTQEELIQEILDERARELAFEGHRWYDLRRTTQPALIRTYDGVTYTLTPEKYTMRFPTEAVEANPEIERWDYTK
ncbi:MAG: RagB/SusD family nutrient uptake outer membrane protein [Bacteroidaceae bacterium]|nr:RagB/SusD family nutrient uptake outer membrane protein [Bacteroidaceae bacterium]